MVGTDRAAVSLRRLATDATIAGAFAHSLWTIAGSGYQVVLRGFMLLMADVPVYVFMTWRGLRAETHAAEVVDAANREPPLGFGSVTPAGGPASRSSQQVPRQPIRRPNMPAVSTPTLHVDSEVGTLRPVLLHRPDLELRQLTPSNCADLLFDNVLWSSGPARSTTPSRTPCATGASKSSMWASCWPRRSRTTTPAARCST